MRNIEKREILIGGILLGILIVGIICAYCLIRMVQMMEQQDFLGMIGQILTIKNQLDLDKWIDSLPQL